MTTSFICVVTAIVMVVTDLGPINTFAIGTLVVTEQPWTGLRFVGTQGHVVLIAAVAAIVLAIAKVVFGDALEITAFESVVFIACEVSAHFFVFVAVITAVIGAIAPVMLADTNVVVAFKFVFLAVPATR